MRQLLALAVSVVALTSAPAAAAPPAFDSDRWFATVARQSLWRATIDAGVSRQRVKPVSVRCYRDRLSFEESFESRAGTPAEHVAAYYAGGRDVHLRNGTCANIRLFFLGRRTVLTAGAYAILLHESLHRQGLVDERFTTCFANEAVRWGSLWFGLSESQSLRARNLAFAYTRLYAPRSYRMGKPNCLLLTRQMEWIELV
jgi:hypothetical protein